MVEGPGRFGLVALLLWAASLALSPARAAGEALDRGAFTTALCGDGAAQAGAVEGFLRSAAEAEAGTSPGPARRCGPSSTGACPASARPPSSSTVPVPPRGAMRPPRRRVRPRWAGAGARLRQRALVETASGAAALLTGPSVAARRAGLAALERRIAAVPEALLLRAASAETDPASGPARGRRPIAAPCRPRTRRAARGDPGRVGVALQHRPLAPVRPQGRSRLRQRSRLSRHPGRRPGPRRTGGVDRQRSGGALQRPELRQHPVHGGGRPRDHLRADGRHQPRPGRVHQ